MVGARVRVRLDARFRTLASRLRNRARLGGLDIAFRDPDAHRILDLVDVGNEASVALAGKLGLAR